MNTVTMPRVNLEHLEYLFEQRRDERNTASALEQGDAFIRHFNSLPQRERRPEMYATAERIRAWMEETYIGSGYGHLTKMIPQPLPPADSTSTQWLQRFPAAVTAWLTLPWRTAARVISLAA